MDIAGSVLSKPNHKSSLIVGSMTGEIHSWEDRKLHCSKLKDGAGSEKVVVKGSRNPPISLN